MPPVGYFRVSDRTTRIEMRYAQRHRRGAIHKVGQRPAHRNIGWHLMPKYSPRGLANE